MKRFTHILTLAILAIALLACLGQAAHAGRIGGPISAVATVLPYDSPFYDIPFFAGETAIISVTGNGQSPLDLYVYDRANNSWQVTGGWDHKTAVINVTRAGYFRVVVRNLGPAPNTFILSTN